MLTRALAAPCAARRIAAGPSSSFAAGAPRRAASTASAAARSIDVNAVGSWDTVRGDVLGDRSAKDAVVFLPALSTVSTRAEGLEMLARISQPSARLAFDWPGWGERRPTDINFSGALLIEYLRSLLTALASDLPQSRIHLVTAGHGCAFTVGMLSTASKPLPKLCSISLISPTWRGPLPTLLARKLSSPTAARLALDALRAILTSGAVGPRAYRSFVTPAQIERQLKAHVYGEPAFATAERVALKARESEHPAAYKASFTFVTGGFDPFASRDLLLGLARGVFLGLSARPGGSASVLVGARSPPSSLADMRALAAVPGCTPLDVPGALLPHEEHPAAVAAAVDAAIARAASL